jgi:nitronate monooxygenase
MVPPPFKQMIVDSRMSDVLYTANISGVPANFLVPSMRNAGLDPAHLPPHEALDMQAESKAWKNIWSAGQGVGGISEVLPVAQLCARLAAEYAEAMDRAAADPFRA